MLLRKSHHMTTFSSCSEYMFTDPSYVRNIFGAEYRLSSARKSDYHRCSLCRSTGVCPIIVGISRVSNTYTRLQPRSRLHVRVDFITLENGNIAKRPPVRYMLHVHKPYSLNCSIFSNNFKYRLQEGIWSQLYCLECSNSKESRAFLYHPSQYQP
jgi:hypothetical protein